MCGLHVFMLRCDAMCRLAFANFNTVNCIKWTDARIVCCLYFHGNTHTHSHTYETMPITAHLYHKNLVRSNVSTGRFHVCPQCVMCMYELFGVIFFALSLFAFLDCVLDISQKFAIRTIFLLHIAVAVLLLRGCVCICIECFLCAFRFRCCFRSFFSLFGSTLTLISTGRRYNKTVNLGN